MSFNLLVTETTKTGEPGAANAGAPAAVSAPQTCALCGDEYDPEFSRTGICFTCSVHAVCACGDPPDR